MKIKANNSILVLANKSFLKISMHKLLESDILPQYYYVSYEKSIQKKASTKQTQSNVEALFIGTGIQKFWNC